MINNRFTKQFEIKIYNNKITVTCCYSANKLEITDKKITNYIGYQEINKTYVCHHNVDSLNCILAQEKMKEFKIETLLFLFNSSGI
jgi:hypothetical protein